MTEDTAIIVKNLSKIYKLYTSPADRLKESLHPLRKIYHHDFFALRDVSLEIKKGESVGIIGKNGSGKSTLLKILSGVLIPTSGTVQVSGKVSALLELGAGFNPELTGVENVYFNGTLMGYTRDEINERLDQILSFADIGEFVYQPIKTYSSGMFVRLAFAVAINVDPEVLIIDEALSVGDMKFQRKCFSRIERFRDDNKTILYVTHALPSVNTLCDTAYLFNDGRLVEHGKASYVTQVFQKMMFDEEDIVENNDAQELLVESNAFNRTTQSNSVLCAGNIVKNDALIKSATDKLNSWDGIKRAEIIDCGILDSNGDKVALLTTGHNYTFYTKVLTYIDHIAIHVGYPITNVKGLLVFAVNTEIQNICLPAQERGSIVEGRVDVNMWLAPGDYFLTFRTGANLEVFDVLYDKIHFRVVGECRMHPQSIVNLEPKVSLKQIGNVDSM